jgi:hypothetical protein
MPLLDHFHNPIKDYCPWHSFQAMWCGKVVERLNETSLADDRFTAQSERHIDSTVEIDVATLERADHDAQSAGRNGAGGGVATAAEVYSPPAAVLTADVEFSADDVYEVKVYRGRGGWHLVAAVELVSEANKDREETRRALAVKCGAYLLKGVSVVVVDTVTTYRANLHDEFCDLIDTPEPVRWTSPTGLSVVVYRPAKVRAGEDLRNRLDVWPYPLAVGDPFPTVPLWLAPDLAVPLELELTYSAARKALKIR